MMYNETKLQSIAYGMGEMARTHPNDTISNALARVSEIVAHLGRPFAEELTETDKKVVQYYLQQIGTSQRDHAA